VAGR
jgi:hypothetical protein